MNFANGALIFVFSAGVLWLLGKGFGPNVGPAWNVFTGAAKVATTTQPPAQPSTPQQSGGQYQAAYVPPPLPSTWGTSIA